MSQLREFRGAHFYKERVLRGVRWRYIACGQGKQTLVLLPNGFMRADQWFYLINALKSQVRILAPDAAALQGLYNLDEASQVLAMMLSGEGVEQACVLGFSAGGGLAQRFCELYPHKVTHLILSHSGTHRSVLKRKEKLQKFLKLLKLQPLFLTRQMLQKKLLADSPANSPWLAFCRAYLKEATNALDKETLISCVEAGLDAVQEPITSLGDWSGEVLLLSSRDDKYSLEELEELHKFFPQAQTHLFSQGGHHTCLLYPEEYANTIRSFLD